MSATNSEITTGYLANTTITGAQTPFSTAEYQQSERAHVAALAQIYPKVFACPQRWLSYQSTQFIDARDQTEHAIYNYLDGTLCIDGVITYNGHLPPLSYSVQERWRDASDAHYQDLTISRKHANSSQWAELTKIAAQWMVFGYYDADTDTILDALVVNVALLKDYVRKGKLTLGAPRTNPRTGQEFYAIPFARLKELPALVEFHLADYVEPDADEWP